MVWKNTDPKHEKLKFIGDWLRGDYSFCDLCKRYDISCKTGYKLINRYEEEGERALQERSHARHTHPNKTPSEVQCRLIELKFRYPKWGPEKLRDWLRLNEPEFPCPATSTIGGFLKKNGLVKPRKLRRHVPVHSEPFLGCNEPNDVWSADFKGQFRMGSRDYCYPLTISDNCSRFLLLCEGFNSPSLEQTKKGFMKAFYEYGLPTAIRTDNGTPFAATGIGGLSRLSIWWLKLGILPERIEPGCPQQNGRHERMHRTLKEATALPPKENMHEQQKAFDTFRKEYNYQRPHKALNGKRPADVYSDSRRELSGRLDEIIYPHHFEIRKVRSNGEIKWAGKRYFVSQLLTGEPVGLEIIGEGIATIYFAKLRLGLIDDREQKIIRPPL